MTHGRGSGSNAGEAASGRANKLGFYCVYSGTQLRPFSHMRSRYSISRFLEGLSPYQSLFVVGVPLAIVEPLKLVALFIVGDGHFIAGVVVMICAYGGSLFVTERLFIILKPKLLTLPWFAKSWSWFVPIRKKLLQWFRRKWIAGAQILFGLGEKL